MVAKIYIWEQLAGAVAWDAKRGYAIFEYDADFLRGNLDIAPLTMPLEQARSGRRVFFFPALNYETYRGLPGLLADALPDKYGNALVDAWLARQGRAPESVTPVERLCITGSRAMGALEFRPGMEPGTGKPELLQVDELVAVANELLEQKKSLKANLGKDKLQAIRSIIQVGTSAGGARAKAIIAYNPETGEVKSGQLPAGDGFEYWMIKFDGIRQTGESESAGYGRIEYAYHKMAMACGIEMTECRLLEEHGRAHFMTRRFDRIQGEKVHLQTLCGLAHLDFNQAGAHSYEQAFQAMRQLRMPYPNAEQLYLRMAFNVMARNQDDHTKNIGFLMNREGRWKLSPAYDMIFAYNPAGSWTNRHQMSINGKREHIERADLLAVANAMNIKQPGKLLDAVKETVANWKQFAKSVNLETAKMNAIAKAHRLL